DYYCSSYAGSDTFFF
nr:immunoglobulin light chain junction region [Macaca mulatta]MOW17054.1 immunoglobulin light chain junction region [Macaca mulatta]